MRFSNSFYGALWVVVYKYVRFQELSMMCGLTKILVLNVRSVFCTLFREVEDAGSS